MASPRFNNMINNGAFNGTQIFVSQTAGNDSNSGSYGAPLRTLNAAVALAGTPSEYVTINILDGGTYDENVTLTDFICINGPYATLEASSGDTLTINLVDGHGTVLVNVANLSVRGGGNSITISNGGLNLACANNLVGNISNSGSLIVNTVYFNASVISNTGGINYTCLGTPPLNVGTMFGFSTGAAASTGGITAVSDITTAGNFATTGTGYIQAFHGNVYAGDSAGNAGSFVSYPASGSTGSLVVQSTSNTANVNTTLTNQASNVGTTFALPHTFVSNISLLGSSLAQVENNANVIWSDTAVPYNAIASGASFSILFNNFAGTFRVREIYINSQGTNFSGGDRNLEIYDGVTSYSIIPAVTLQALVNARWGDPVNLPFPASASIATPTTPPYNLQVHYQGGTTDYTAGSITITACWEKIA